jgi:hypothetical protein
MTKVILDKEIEILGGGTSESPYKVKAGEIMSGLKYFIDSLGATEGVFVEFGPGTLVFCKRSKPSDLLEVAVLRPSTDWSDDEIKEALNRGYGVSEIQVTVEG